MRYRFTYASTDNRRVTVERATEELAHEAAKRRLERRDTIKGREPPVSYGLKLVEKRALGKLDLINGSELTDEPATEASEADAAPVA